MPALAGQLVWDDKQFLLDSPLYRTASSALSAALSPFLFSPNYFRPFGVFSFVWELRIFGADSWEMHLVNLLLHCANVALLAALFARCNASREKPERGGGFDAALATLIFGVHPVMSECVGFVSCRFDLMLTTCTLLLLHVSILPVSAKGRSWLMALCIFGACLCKESGVALLVAVPLAGWRAGEAGKFRRDTCACVTGVALYLAFRWRCLGYLIVPTAEARVPTGSPLQHLVLVGRTFVEYLLLTVSPFGRLGPLHFAELPLSASDPAGWIGVATLGLAGVLLAVSAPRSAVARLLLAWLAALAPVLNIAPLELSGSSFAAERFLMLPMIFMSLACFCALRNLPLTRGRPAALRAIVIIFLCACALEARAALAKWRNDCELWTYSESQTPRSPTALNNLALCHLEMRDFEAAESLLRRSLAIAGGQAEAWANFGIALGSRGRLGEAEAAFRKAVQIAPDNAVYLTNLAECLRMAGRIPEAREYLDKALAADPTLGRIHHTLALIAMDELRWPEALEELAKAIPLTPRAGDRAALRMLAAEITRDIAAARTIAEDPRYRDAGVDMRHVFRLMRSDPSHWRKKLDGELARTEGTAN